jgi:hypothetical protein
MVAAHEGARPVVFQSGDGMRRSLVVAGMLAVAVTGCKDAFKSHADVAAEAGEIQLTSERLAAILTGPKEVRLNREAAQFVTNLWVDYALFAQAVAAGTLPMDSAAIEQALWPVIAEIRQARWHDSLMARRGSVTAEDADKLYAGNDVRVFQHMLFGVQPTAVPEERAAARKRAEDALAAVRSGRDFGAVARTESQDVQSAQDSGFLPPSPRGQWVAQFDSAGWQLAPGAMTGIVETSFGYHIIKRPGREEVRDRLLAHLRNAVGSSLDSFYLDSLAIGKKLEVKSSAPGEVRKAMDDLDEAGRSDKTVATFEGGKLTMADLVRWVRGGVPPQYHAQLKAAPDSQLMQFTRAIAQSELLLRQADSAGVRLTPVEWQSMQQRYRADIDSLKNDMALNSDVTDSTVSLGERAKVAQMKIDRYFDRFIAREMRLRPVPAMLSGVLRSRMEYEINEAGVDQGLKLAEATHAQDSTAAGPQGMPGGAQMAPGGLQPAPGPAPVPGGAGAAPAPGTGSARP